MNNVSSRPKEYESKRQWDEFNKLGGVRTIKHSASRKGFQKG
jgi:hypothetical protein